jgi:hypothetical protein
MAMKRVKPAVNELRSDFRAFFYDLKEFKEDINTKKMRFIREFPEKKLRIIVTVPIHYHTSCDVDVVTGLHIEFAVEFDGKTCLEFQDSRAVDGWTKTTMEKIKTLVDLVAFATTCPRCESLTYPHKSMDNQVHPKGTQFVWYTCDGKKCITNIPTPYGIGLKTAVSRYLKRD